MSTRLSTMISNTRARRGQTVAIAAKAAQTTNATFCRWEHGALPRLSHMPQIAKYLGIGVGEARALRADALVEA